MPRSVLLELALLLALAGCRAQPNLDDIILSYSEANTFCINCPRFRVDFRSGGQVDYACLGSCAVPGEQHHVVPAERFRELVQALRDARFFAIPRTDGHGVNEDATVIRITYRDERRIHEVVDGGRNNRQIASLANRLKTATEVDRYLKPSLALYRRLVDSGWDVNTLGPDRQNALFSAVSFRDLESTRFLLEQGSKVTDESLNIAARTDNVEILRLVVRSSQVNLSAKLGASMLAQATRSRKTDLVRFLLDSGAEVNSHGAGDGGTPLMSAANSGSFENARLLLSKGADANARDNSGRAALSYAAILDNTGLISLLAEHGADVNARDNDGRTALMLAADYCVTWDIRALLDAGADPTVRDKHGRTALELHPVRFGDPKCTTARNMIGDALTAR